MSFDAEVLIQRPNVDLRLEICPKCCANKAGNSCIASFISEFESHVSKIAYFIRNSTNFFYSNSPKSFAKSPNQQSCYLLKFPFHCYFVSLNLP